MKKVLLSLIFGLSIMFIFNSCETYTAIMPTDDGTYINVETSVERYRNVDFNVIVRYGTPYYYNESLLYYMYNNLYYYPFYYDNYWYVRVYSRPIGYRRYRPYFRPNRHDYRFKPGNHPGYNQPHHRPSIPQRMNGPQNHKPNVGAPRTPQSTNRPNGSYQRPNNRNDRFGNRR